MKAGIEVPAAGRRSQFASDSDAAERRLIQSNNDASGYLQRVAGRLIRTAPTKSHSGDEKIMRLHRICRGRPKGRPVVNSWHILV